MVSEAPGSFRHDGHRLAYTTYGEGPRLVVLIHGLLLSQRMHQPLARALAAGRWYVPEKRPFLAHVTVARVRGSSRPAARQTASATSR